MNDEFYNASNELKLKLGVCEKLALTKEESRLFASMVKNGEELPADIMRGEYPEEFFRVVPIYKTYEELQEYCLLHQTKNIRTIKNCVVFFTTIAVISLALSFLSIVFS